MKNELTPWTDADEKALRDLIVRRSQHSGNARKIMDDLIKRTWPFLPITYEKKAVEMRNWLIHNASDFRDALAPFDSGVRVEYERKDEKS